MVSGWAGRLREEVCLACISETAMCRKLILGTWGRGCRCATSWCDLDLIFDLAVVTVSLKILSGLYLGNRVGSFLVGALIGGVGVQRHGVTLI